MLWFSKAGPTLQAESWHQSWEHPQNNTKQAVVLFPGTLALLEPTTHFL